MTIQRRGESFRVLFVLYRDEQGRKVYAPTKSFATFAEAQAEEDRLRYEKGLRAKITKRGSTLDLLESWFAAKRFQSDGHRQRCRCAIDTYLAPLHDTQVRFLDVEEVIAVYDAIRARGLAEPTVRKAHQTLRSALKWGVQRKWCLTNVAAQVDFSDNPLTTQRVACPSRAEVGVLLAKATDANWAALLRFDAECGARRGELCALNWGDIDLDARTVRIDKARSYVGKGEGNRDKGPKSFNGVRSFRLSAGLCAVLAAERTRQLTGPVVSLSGAHSASPVFVSTTGARYTPHALTSRFQTFRNGLDLRHIHLHSLRHFAATTMLTAGVPLHEVAAVLGDNMQTVAKTYRHVLPAIGQNAADAMDRAFA